MALADIAIFALYVANKGVNLYGWDFKISLIVSAIVALVLSIFAFLQKDIKGLLIKGFLCVAWVFALEDCLSMIPEIFKLFTGNGIWILRLFVFFFAMLLHILASKNSDDYYSKDMSYEERYSYEDDGSEDYYPEDDYEDEYEGDYEDDEEAKYQYKYKYKYQYKYMYGDEELDSEDINSEELNDTEYYEDEVSYEDDYNYRANSRDEDGEDPVDYEEEVFRYNSRYKSKYANNRTEDYEDRQADYNRYSSSDDYSDYDSDDYENQGNLSKRSENGFERFKRHFFTEKKDDAYTDESNDNAKKDNNENPYHNDGDVVSRLFLGCNDKESLLKRYRSLMKTFHPDTGNGDLEMAQEIQKKYKELLEKYN